MPAISSMAPATSSDSTTSANNLPASPIPRSARPALSKRAPRGGAADASFHARRGVAIIDEIDSVLVDEACIPLIISEGGAPAGGDASFYAEALRVAGRLREDVDYTVDREATAPV